MADVAPTQQTAPDPELLAVAEQFASIGRELADAATTTVVLEKLVVLTVELVPGARWASITRGLSERFTTLCASSPVAKAADDLQYRLGTGPCVDAVIADAVFDSDDLAMDQRWSLFGPQVARDHGIRSVLSLRLSIDADEDLNAALNIYGDRRQSIDRSSRSVADLLATHAGIAIASIVHRQEAEQLRRALVSSREIGAAVGVVMALHKLTRDQAFDLLTISSQATNRKLRDIAAEVVHTGELILSPPDRRAHRSYKRSTRSAPPPA